MSARGPGEESPSLTSDEKRYFGQLFKAADTEGLGVITGDVAVKFFEKSGLPSSTLGQIWEISDKDNTGFLTPQSFSVALRLIGQAQNGQAPDASLAKRAGALPRFDGFPMQKAPAPPKARAVQPLSPEDRAKYLQTWQAVNPTSPLLDGDRAKTVFQKANLPIEQLGQIWALTDTKQRGALDMVEFIVAMHLIQGVMNGQLKSIPSSLPPTLFEAAARGPPSARSQRQQPSVSSLQEPLQQQFSGQRQGPIRTQLTGPPGRASPAPRSEVWDIKPHDKANYDTFFAGIDKDSKGYITGEEAVGFFVQSKLPEDELAQVWDLSDVDNSGMLNADSFAVAMHLIKIRMRGEDLPNMLPASLIPPAMRPKVAAPTAAVFAEAQAQSAPIPSSAAADLFGLNDSFAPAPSKSPPVGAFANNFGIDQAVSPVDSNRGFGGKPAFVPSSSFGQAIQQAPQARNFSPVQRSMDPDLLGDAAPQESLRHAGDATELANLNNSISSLNKQHAATKQERAQVEADVGQLKAQKQDLTARLANVRGMYDAEVAAVRQMQAEQGQIRNENKELAKEASLLEASLGAVRQNHEQLTAQLAQDKAENAAIKDKIRLANEASTTLKAQLETLKKDTKQQRGLVAINNKQLATLEAEHAKIRQGIEEEKQQAIAAEKERIEMEQKIKAVEAERAKALEEQKESAFSPKSAAVPAALAAVAVPVAAGAAIAAHSNHPAQQAAAPEHDVPSIVQQVPESADSPVAETPSEIPTTTRMNPFHRAASPETQSTRAISGPTGIFARLNDGSDIGPAFPFVKTAAAGAAVAGVSAGAAAVAFGHAAKSSESQSARRSPESIYDTAPTTAQSEAIHPAFADAFTSDAAPAAGFTDSFSGGPPSGISNFSQPPAFTDRDIPQDAPRDTAPAEFQTFEHNAPEFENEASQLHSQPEASRAIHSPQPIAAQAQNWSTEDAFTRDERVDSPALATEPKGVRGPSLLGFKSTHSDDGSVGTSVQAQPPASALQSPSQSRMSTPTVQEPSSLAREEQMDAHSVQQTLAHPPHDEDRAIPQDTSSTDKKSSGLSGLLGNIFSKKDDAKDKKAASDDSFEHLEAAEEAESSDDETVEQPGARAFAPAASIPEAPVSAGLPVYADNSTSTHLASVPAKEPQGLSGLLPERSGPSLGANSAKPRKDDLDEFDDLEEAQEADEDEVNQSYMSQEFDPTFDAPTARSSMLPPPNALHDGNRSGSPAQDWSDFSHYSSVVGDRSSTLAPSLPNTAAQAFGITGQPTSTGRAFDSAFVDSANAKSPPAVPPHSHGGQLTTPVQASGATLQPAKPDLTRQVSAADDPMLVELMEMGFDRQKSVSALEKFNYDLGSATHYLLGGN